MNPLIYALAGLLHDIGKFGQRAEQGDYSQSTYLSPQAKQLAGQICRLTQGGWYSHQHVIWTYWLLEQNRGKFVDAGLSTPSDDLVNLASYHHRPSTDQQGIITLADWCSSGLDRDNEAMLERHPDWENKSKFRHIPIVSIFPELYANGEKMQQTSCAYPVQKFCIDAQILPQHVNNITNNPQLYQKLWKEFTDIFGKLPVPRQRPSQFIETVFHLLKLYTWYMPASTVDYPNISLFEHCKVTGAFAHCIAAYWNQFPDAFQANDNHRLSIAKGHYPFKLWSCNVSGIQKFIYNITNKSAAKSLKGRSLFVQLLLESIAREILERVGG
ncbi:MAG: HD domain-containing protein, partial [Thermoflavifilum sp.]|nr:HD domain-containing protein [Thermoflavifilum sp.]